jgi:glutamyl-tRNA synthetase
VAQPARVALTGRTASPGLFDVVAALGKTETLRRLQRAAAVAESTGGVAKKNAPS